MDSDDAVEMPITGELDLHTFRPQELGDLIPDYIELCREKGIHEIRIIHGKGTGTLRETVHRLLERNPHVDGFRLGSSGTGSWGATLASLKPIGH